MKMIIAIIHHSDASKVCTALLESGIQYTNIAATGGFLKKGNSTLLIGTEEHQVDSVISNIREHCSKHTDGEVTEGAVIFVTAVDEFKKL